MKHTRKWFRGIFYVNAKTAATIGILLLIGLVAGGGMAYNTYQNNRIDPVAYKPLLNTIAKGESRGNYNAYFANASNTDIRLTDMSVSQVLAWQEAYVRQGSPSSAAGKYQIIRPTLESLVRKLKIDPATKFDEHTQDKMAVALLEKRGADDFMHDKISSEQFAANLAQEWAALPKATKPNPEKSYYAGDGINKEQITLDEVFKAIAAIKQ